MSVLAGPDTLTRAAEHFKVLGEPARLQILHSLRGGERSVTDLVRDTGLAQANVSKHLQLLYAAGFVVRHKAGLFVYYAIADDRVYGLCDLMCDRL